MSSISSASTAQPTSPPVAQHVEPSDTDNIGPLGQIASSLTGAVITSLLVTPLDVVKTRIQAQQKPVLSGSSSYLHSAGLMDQLCHCHDALAASADFNRRVGRGTNTAKCNGGFPATSRLKYQAIMTSCKTMWPGSRHTILEHAKLCPLYRRTETVKFSGTVDALVKISRTEGTRSLWSGLSPTLLMSVPATILYFTVYDNLRTMCIRRLHMREWIAGASAGAAARLVSATVVSPLELIRTKIQSERLNYRDVFAAASSDIRTHGIRSLWRGWTPTVLRDVPFSCIYWMCYETLKKQLLLSRRDSSSDAPIRDSKFISGPESFVAGVCSGTVAAILTLPFDVVKTYRQMELGQQQKGISRSSSQLKSSSVYSDARTFVILRQIYEQRGFRALFAGIVPRVGKVAPACGIMISTFELGKKHFSRLKYLKQLEDGDGTSGHTHIVPHRC